MRILIAGANRSTVGGAEMYQLSLIPTLLAGGHAVALLYERATVPGKPVLDEHRREVSTWCVADMGEGGALRAVSAWQPDVVYVQGLVSPALEAALVARHRCVLFAHAYYGTCATGTKRFAVPRVNACTRRIGIGCWFRFLPRRCGGLNPRRFARSYRLQLRRFELLPGYRAVLVASEHMRREYERHGVDPERLHVTPLPPAGISAPVEAPPLPRSSGRVLFSGRLTNLKGVDHLLRALPGATKQLGRRLSLVVVGDGPEHERLDRLATELDVDTEFLSWVDVHKRNELLRSAELLAVPSLWPEPWGLTGMEAACVGVPSVAYATGGITDWLVPGESGELAPTCPPTARGLAEAIVRALGNRKHYARLSHGAWTRARSFTVDSHIERLMPLFERAAGGST